MKPRESSSDPSFRFARVRPEGRSDSEISTRLRKRLFNLRRKAIIEREEGDDARNFNYLTPEALITKQDLARIDRRAACIASRYGQDESIKHLRQNERERLQETAHRVRLIHPPTEHAVDEIVAKLHREFPWLEHATTEIWHAMRRSLSLGLPALRFPPLVLDGPPGIGKSAFARQVADLLGVPSLVIDASSEPAGFSLAGTQRGWSSASPGRPVNLILDHAVANPLIVVDEAEKVATVESTSGTSHAITNALLPLLERSSAAAWNCPFYQLPFDMSWVTWFLTVNDAMRLSAPLRSRCSVISLREITLHELLAFAEREGRRRKLSAISIEVVLEALDHAARQFSRKPPSLRSVLRMLDRAEALEQGPMKN